MKKGKRKEQDERLAAMFFGICEVKLRPLLDEYGLIMVHTDDGGGYNYYTVIFQNEIAALRVYFEWREKYLSVQVCRLVDGEVQRDPESLNVEWTCFHVGDLLTVRASDYDQQVLLLPEGWRGEEATMEEIGRSLEKYAEALHAHGGDVLRGDFSIFPQLDRIAKQRARERQAWYEETTAWRNKRTE